MAWLPDGESMAGSPMPGMATTEQLASLRAAEGIDVDRMFLDLMILPYLGGLHLVDGVLELADDSNVTWLAGVTRQGQGSELQAMQDLLAELG